MINQAYLKSILDYEPETGIFRWKIVKRGWRGKTIAFPGDRAGHIERDGYWRISIDGKFYLMHRLAWLWMTGDWPEIVIDHKDRDKGNNKWANLRDATYSENSRNSSRRTREEILQDREKLLEARDNKDAVDASWQIAYKPSLRRPWRCGSVLQESHGVASCQSRSDRPMLDAFPKPKRPFTP